MSIFTKIRSGLANDVKAAARIVRRGPNLGSNDMSKAPLWFSTRNYINRRVDADTAMTITAVYRAVAIIASTISGLPMHIYRENQFGVVEMEESPSTAYLWNRPNPEMARPFFWETVISHEVLNGNAYLFVVKNGDGLPLELWPIHPSRVQVERRDGQKLYFIDSSSVARLDFSAGGEIVHIPNMSRDGLVGLSPITLAAQAIALAQEAEEYGTRFFSEDAIPPGLLTTEAALTREQTRDLAADWKALHAGSNRDIGVLANGAKFQAISINPEDAQLLSGRKFQITEIARLFGVPPWMLADMDHASQGGGNGLEEQGRNFLMYCLQPHILRFESAIEDALLVRRETRRKIRFVTDGLLRSNYQARMQGHATAHGRFMTANEIRKLEGLPPIEGGDVLLQMVNLAPAPELAELTLSDEKPAAVSA